MVGTLNVLAAEGHKQVRGRKKEKRTEVSTSKESTKYMREVKLKVMRSKRKRVMEKETEGRRGVRESGTPAYFPPGKNQV